MSETPRNGCRHFLCASLRPAKGSGNADAHIRVLTQPRCSARRWYGTADFSTSPIGTLRASAESAGSCAGTSSPILMGGIYWPQRGTQR